MRLFFVRFDKPQSFVHPILGMSRSNAWSAKPMVGVYPEWARRPADDLSSGLVDGFRHAGTMSRNPCWRRPGDLPIEQASKLTLLSLADEVIE
jgi:hypothetical protein